MIVVVKLKVKTYDRKQLSKANQVFVSMLVMGIAGQKDQARLSCKL